MIKLGENNMKKFLIALLFLLPAHSFAAGPYDGIWAIFPYGYFTISERDNVLIVVTLGIDDDDGKWAAYQGPRNGNIARLQTVYGNAQVIIDTTFDSDTTSRAAIVSCEPNPGYYCAFPVGTILNATKVW